MTDYDLIIVSNTFDDSIFEMTQYCIDSALATVGDRTVNVILVETGRMIYNYRDVDVMVHFTDEFRYNAALNAGLKHRQGRVQLLANNDLIFHEGWGDTSDLMELNDFLSGSVLSKSVYHANYKIGKYAYDGYTIGRELTGWLIFTHHKLWNIIGELPTNYVFWFSDNDYAEVLKEKGIKHYLMCHAVVEHIESVSTKKLSREKQIEFTSKEVEKWGQRGLSEIFTNH